MRRSTTPIRYLVVPLALVIAILGALMVLAQDGIYTVQRGDTLDTIAQRYNISLDALLAANGLAAGVMIFPGDTLFIPSDAPVYGVALSNEANQGGGGDGTAFLLQRGDTLDLLAARYNVDLACLIAFNNVSYPPYVQAGTIIVIPFDCPPYAGLSTAAPGALRGFEVGSFARPTRAAPTVAAPDVSAPTQESLLPAPTTQPQVFATQTPDPNATVPPLMVTATPLVTATAQG